MERGKRQVKRKKGKLRAGGGEEKTRGKNKEEDDY